MIKLGRDKLFLSIFLIISSAILLYIIIANVTIFNNLNTSNKVNLSFQKDDCKDINIEELSRNNSKYPQFTSYKLKNSPCSDYCFIKYIENKFKITFTGTFYDGMFYCFSLNGDKNNISKSFTKQILENKQYVQFNETILP